MRFDEFDLPPRLTNEQGHIRTAGFEIEFGGLEAQAAAEIVATIYGGQLIEKGSSEFCVETALGTFTVELDTSIGREPPRETDFVSTLEAGALKLARSAMNVVIPQEITTPPIPLDRLKELNPLERELSEAGAKGTEDSAFYAFALHINPEAPSLSAVGIASIMKAFSTLRPTLWKRIQPDLPRRLIGFAEPYPDDYISMLLSDAYWPDLGALIDDYIASNPTRNRDLDLLPLFCFLDETRVRRPLPDEKICPRPTFHYRLPDSQLSDPNWSIASEWNRWVDVERLAATLSRDKVTAQIVGSANKPPK
jgi:hypothetical protein